MLLMAKQHVLEGAHGLATCAPAPQLPCDCIACKKGKRTWVMVLL